MENFFNTFKTKSKEFALIGFKFILLFLVSIAVEHAVELLMAGFDSKIIEFLLNEIGSDMVTKVVLKIAIIFGIMNQDSRRNND